MWNLITNPIVSHLIVAALAGAGTWWVALKTKLAALEASAHTELLAVIADARADFATAAAAVKTTATTVVTDINKAV